MTEGGIILTVGDLKQALADVPDSVPFDIQCEGTSLDWRLEIYSNEHTHVINEAFIEIGEE